MKSHPLVTSHAASSYAQHGRRSSSFSRPHSSHHAYRPYSTYTRGTYGSEYSSLARPSLPSSPSPSIRTLDTLLATEMPEPSWVLPDLLPKGITLLAGKAGAGKSSFALACALAITNGEAIAGKVAPTGGDVLYLDLEENARRMQSRIYKMLQGRPALPSFSWAEQWNALSEGGLADIEEWLEGHPAARCVVIDTLEQVWRKGEHIPLLAAEEYNVLLPLTVIAESYHIAIVLLHHLSKHEANDLLDSGRSPFPLFDRVDCSMLLTREPGQTDATLYISGQSIAEQNIALSFEPSSAQWRLKRVLQ